MLFRSDHLCPCALRYFPAVLIPTSAGNASPVRDEDLSSGNPWIPGYRCVPPGPPPIRPGRSPSRHSYPRPGWTDQPLSTWPTRWSPVAAQQLPLLPSRALSANTCLCAGQHVHSLPVNPTGGIGSSAPGCPPGLASSPGGDLAPVVGRPGVWLRSWRMLASSSTERRLAEEHAAADARR